MMSRLRGTKEEAVVVVATMGLQSQHVANKSLTTEIPTFNRVYAKSTKIMTST